MIDYKDPFGVNPPVSTRDDYIALTAEQNPPLNPITGTLGKAFDTFLDALAIQGAKKIVGTDYPTGQQSPEAVAAREQALREQAAAMPVDWRPYAVGAAFLIGALVVVSVLTRKPA